MHCVRVLFGAQYDEITELRSVEVNFFLEEGDSMWATIYPDVLKKICSDSFPSSVEEITKLIKDMQPCTVVVEKQAVKDIIIPEDEHVEDNVIQPCTVIVEEQEVKDTLVLKIGFSLK